MSNFEQWLCTQLASLKVDTDVFTSYIHGILEGDESREQKFEAIEGILSDACQDTSMVSSKTDEIISKFSRTTTEGTNDSDPVVQSAAGAGMAFEDQVRSLFSLQTAKAAESAGRKKVGASSEDDKVKQLKSSILNQYGQVEVEVDDLDPTGESVISEICFALLGGRFEGAGKRQESRSFGALCKTQGTSCDGRPPHDEEHQCTGCVRSRETQERKEQTGIGS
ncbi:coiled-coil domain-containing protein 43-like isoform X2 [Varroa jacobsoni]|uniref:Coiled-coil domain-containing protein 43 n=1 Tax=Varroa destructor TaxID=109461 RepID=A0A7M7JRK3_VARDE|nr:coiled-coil domain-containing protein 43-like isoform X2 [Varroa destructor]XP_022702496.1 coiled-coil domain-containing protein 43-like isoform X2 [Varroa jacobsoni]